MRLFTRRKYIIPKNNTIFAKNLFFTNMENFKFDSSGYLVTEHGKLPNVTTTPQKMYNFLLKLRKTNNKELINEYIEMFKSDAPFPCITEDNFYNELKRNSGL